MRRGHIHPTAHMWRSEVVLEICSCFLQFQGLNSGSQACMLSPNEPPSGLPWWFLGPLNLARTYGDLRTLHENSTWECALSILPSQMTMIYIYTQDNGRSMWRIRNDSSGGKEKAEHGQDGRNCSPILLLRLMNGWWESGLHCYENIAMFR